MVFLLYNLNMFNNQKLGAFIVPTGTGASIGGYAGDASCWARKFSEFSRLIVNPNVVNAGGFSGITDNMFYVEGHTMDEFFKGKLCLRTSSNNKVGVVLDKGMSKDVLNIHINTINAVKTVYGIDIIYEITEENVGVEFFVNESGISMGSVKNIKTVLDTSKKLLEQGAEAIAIVCLFADDNQNEDYENGIGVDPVGGVEAIISHYISRELKVPCAHSPAFEDYSISTDLVSPKSASEYITPTFLPCILIGLSQAPKIISPPLANHHSLITVDQLDFLVMPYNSLGSTPVFEALKRGIKVFAVKENSTVLNVDKNRLKLDGVTEIETYEECLNAIKNS